MIALKMGANLRPFLGSDMAKQIYHDLGHNSPKSTAGNQTALTGVVGEDRIRARDFSFHYSSTANGAATLQITCIAGRSFRAGHFVLFQSAESV